MHFRSMISVFIAFAIKLVKYFSQCVRNCAFVFPVTVRLLFNKLQWMSFSLLYHFPSSSALLPYRYLPTVDSLVFNLKIFILVVPAFLYIVLQVRRAPTSAQTEILVVNFILQNAHKRDKINTRTPAKLCAIMEMFWISQRLRLQLAAKMGCGFLIHRIA